MLTDPGFDTRRARRERGISIKPRQRVTFLLTSKRRALEEMASASAPVAMPRNAVREGSCLSRQHASHKRLVLEARASMSPRSLRARPHDLSLSRRGVVEHRASRSTHDQAQPAQVSLQQVGIT